MNLVRILAGLAEVIILPENDLLKNERNYLLALSLLFINITGWNYKIKLI